MATVKHPENKGAAQLLVCDCEKTMQPDGEQLAKHFGHDKALPVYTELCRHQAEKFTAALDNDAPVIVACTQEAPLFRELAEEAGREDLTFINIRERAGWCTAKSSERPNVTAKMAALLADGMHRPKPAGLMTLESEGQCLVYGSGQQVLDTAAALADRLSVTVIFLDAGEVVPPSTINVPLHIGHIRQISGSLGNFTVAVDGFAPARPSSRQAMAFEPPRNGFSTTCDLVLDLSGGAALVSGDGRRDGYFRVDPKNPAAVAKAMFEISDMVGEFEKPLYVNYEAGICAHSRSAKVGCRNCLDHCPTGAIESDGDNVKIDPAVCGGCGNCSAMCPTGAVSYAYPARDDTLARLQGLAAAYASAGGTNPSLVLHDEAHGAGAIAMMARYGRGLPPSTIPLALFSVFQTGHEQLATAIASGFGAITIIAPPDKPHDLPALENQVALTNEILAAFGYGSDRVAIVVEQDPDAIEAALYRQAEHTSLAARTFSPVGGKRDVARLAFNALSEAAPQPCDIVQLGKGAPYGRVEIDAPNCTLCLACVGACPAGALAADEERPRLTFNEAACVQCGLCVATCPERVITLDPRLNLTSAVLDPVLIKEEEPFECIKCGKPFGTKSTVERIIAKLEGKHAMFQNSGQIDIIKMCDDCRVITVSDAGGDPMTLGQRPRVRTTEDYLMGNVDDDET